MQTTRGAPKAPYIMRMRGETPRDRIQRPLPIYMSMQDTLLRLIDGFGLDVRISRTESEYQVHLVPDPAAQDDGATMPQAVYRCGELLPLLSQAVSDYTRVAMDPTAARLTKKRILRCLM